MYVNVLHVLISVDYDLVLGILNNFFFFLKLTSFNCDDLSVCMSTGAAAAYKSGVFFLFCFYYFLFIFSYIPFSMFSNCLQTNSKNEISIYKKKSL